MSQPPNHQPPLDPNRTKVAPPPPPPLGVALSQAGSRASGFNPRSGRLALEVTVVLLAVVGLGLCVIFAGGRLASWATPLVPLSVDQRLGQMADKQSSLLATECDNPEVLAYVERVAQPLLAAAQPLPFTFQFKVADTEMVNAFALPGGYVTVNYGLLTSAQSGEEVAGVIAHEIQHALLRHGTRRMLRQMGSSALMLVIFGASDLHTLGQTAGQLASLSYDRDQESESDQRGVDLLVRAHINPQGLATFFERLARDSPNPPELLSTHPDSGRRAQVVAQAARGGSFQPLPSPQGLRCRLD